MSLKEQKEQFVSGLLGGPIDEIYYVTSISLTAYLTLCKVGSSNPVADFALNVVSLLAAITVYSNSVGILHLLVAAPLVLVIFKRTKNTKSKSKSSPEILPKKPFITAYRSHMLIITNLAIAAVDFRVFPRRFAKVETWGTSLMDLGVGSFVFSMGLANSRSLIRKKFELAKVAESGQKSLKNSAYIYAHLIGENFIKSIRVLLLGVIRLVSVKSLEYQEHASEYGIHWNFFMTLGLLPLFLAILNPILETLPRVVVAALVGVGYEVVLAQTGLQNFVLNPENRNWNLITMNKEGICSFFGYLSIFLFGQSFGSFVLTGYRTPNNLFRMLPSAKPAKSSFFTVSTTQGLFIAMVFFHLLFWYVQNSFFFSNVSRRLANFPYIVWVVSYNSTLLLGYNIIERFTGGCESTVLNALNRNGMAIFLLANLLTGLLNMTINTLETSAPLSFGLLLGYAATFTIVAAVLDKKRLYIKI